MLGGIILCLVLCLIRGLRNLHLNHGAMRGIECFNGTARENSRLVLVVLFFIVRNDNFEMFWRSPSPSSNLLSPPSGSGRRVIIRVVGGMGSCSKLVLAMNDAFLHFGG